MARRRNGVRRQTKPKRNNQSSMAKAQRSGNSSINYYQQRCAWRNNDSIAASALSYRQHGIEGSIGGDVKAA